MLHFSWLSKLCTKIKSVFTKAKQIEEHYGCDCNSELDEEWSEPIMNDELESVCDFEIPEEADDKVVKELNRTRVKRVLKKTKKLKKGETK